ncbi:MAG: RIP metalloprotease RseP [Candidatus Moraniibacteriota bacterium]
MLTILIFALVLGVLVFVHELGHFLVARMNGIKADEFGFGFPPRIFGVVKDDATGRYRFVRGNTDVVSPHTVYSLNWIPLGGFVKIKGEDRNSAAEVDSFASRSAWTRIKVLGAGVAMNFLLAWLLFSIVLMLGFPEQIDPTNRGKYTRTDVQILQVQPHTPAEEIGLKAGDIILALDTTPVTTLDFVSTYIREHRGQEISVKVRRGGAELILSGTPRVSTPEGEGALGISFSETAIVRYPWYQAIRLGFEQTYVKTAEILGALGGMIASVFTGAKTEMDIAGPVGIVTLTKQMSELGLTYLLYFAAILSINLGIINILPIPALDGGRILFVLIEKIKGSPVSTHIEGYVHQIGFILLLLLMVLVTLNDIIRLQFWSRFSGWF